MDTYWRNQRGIIAICFLLFGFTLIAFPYPTPKAQAAVTNETIPYRIQAFDLVAEDSGWIVLNSELFWTDNAGASWQTITPSLGEGELIGAVTFLDRHQGWLLTVKNGRFPEYRLAKTADTGQTWQWQRLDLFTDDDPGRFARAIQLHFLDSQLGWLTIRQATSSNFHREAQFKTADGGKAWARVALIEDNEPMPKRPLITPTNPPPANTHQLAMLSATTGWGVQTSGECTATRVDCTTTTRLWQTDDDEESWQPVPLPQLDSVSASVTNGRSPTLMPLTSNTAIFTGHGIDSCDIPTLSQLQTWSNASPYGAVNLYIGGVHRACANSDLTAVFLQQLSQQGWVFIPTWVGPQAACSGYTHRMSSDTATAYAEGESEAAAALAAAQTLGLTDSTQSGTVIYYDLEGYSGSSNQACRDAAKAFMAGWTAKLHTKGSKSGVYGSACASYLSDFAASVPTPDAIWPAHWYSVGGTGGYDSTASVFNVDCISNSLWANQQRIRQYAGDITETWGNVSLNIDSNVLDGLVATPNGSSSCCGCANVAVRQEPMLPQPNFVDRFGQVEAISVSPFEPMGPERMPEHEWVGETGEVAVVEETAVSPPTPDHTPPTGSLTINNGSKTTPSLNIKLTIHGHDDQSGLAAMRFRQPRQAWSNWLPYQSTHFWQLQNHTDTQTIMMQLQDEAGNLSNIQTASIQANLTTPLPASTNYSIAKSILGSSGGLKTSAAYTLQSTSGQPFATETLQSNSYQLHSGYWHETTNCTTPAVTTTAIMIAGLDLQLNWVPVSGATGYNIYRSIGTPYFMPTTVYATTNNPPWSDEGILGTVGNNYTYIIRAIGVCGESFDSQRLGQFNFTLQTGE